MPTLHVETITPGKDERIVQLTAPVTIAGQALPAGAAVIVSAATAEWMIVNQVATLADSVAKEDGAKKSK